jgi:hypothetical protein
MYAARMQAAKQEIQVSGNIQNAHTCTASYKLRGLMMAHLNNHHIVDTLTSDSTFV